MRKIILSCFGIVLHLEGSPGEESGSVSSDLHHDLDGNRFPEDETLDAALDGIESLILAHACAGIDVLSPAYIHGIEVAVESAVNHLG